MRVSLLNHPHLYPTVCTPWGQSVTVLACVSPDNLKPMTWIQPQTVVRLYWLTQQSFLYQNRGINSTCGWLSSLSWDRKRRKVPSLGALAGTLVWSSAFQMQTTPMQSGTHSKARMSWASTSLTKRWHVSGRSSQYRRDRHPTGCLFFNFYLCITLVLVL